MLVTRIDRRGFKSAPPDVRAAAERSLAKHDGGRSASRIRAELLELSTEYGVWILTLGFDPSTEDDDDMAVEFLTRIASRASVAA